MPEVEIHCGESWSDQLDELPVPVADSVIPSWREIPIGTRLSFTAVLNAGIFPCVQIDTFKDGRTMVMIGVSDGRPLNTTVN